MDPGRFRQKGKLQRSQVVDSCDVDDLCSSSPVLESRSRSSAGGGGQGRHSHTCRGVSMSVGHTDPDCQRVTHDCRGHRGHEQQIGHELSTLCYVRRQNYGCHNNGARPEPLPHHQHVRRKMIGDLHRPRPGGGGGPGCVMSSRRLVDSSQSAMLAYYRRLDMEGADTTGYLHGSRIFVDPNGKGDHI